MPTITDWISAISAVVSAIATVVLVYVAIRGLGQWRASLKAQADLDLARQLTAEALDYQEKYHQTRAIVIGPNESAGRVTNWYEQAMSQDQQNFLNESYVRRNRLQLLADSWIKLDATRLEVGQNFGDDIANLIAPLEKPFRELQAAMEIYVNSKFTELMQHQSPEKYQAYHELLNGTSDDKHGRAVNQAVENLLTALIPYRFAKK